MRGRERMREQETDRKENERKFEIPRGTEKMRDREGEIQRQ